MTFQANNDTKRRIFRGSRLPVIVDHSDPSQNVLPLLPYLHSQVGLDIQRANLPPQHEHMQVES